MSELSEKLMARVRRIREAAGFTQAEVAAGIGMSLLSYSKMEKSQRKCFIEDVVALARFFHISIEELMADRPVEVTGRRTVVEKRHEAVRVRVQ